ncbi:MAG: hypothetical protein JO286_21120 [Solirubrobacterales bacterium]|nr:hypothetical protein [Solirubrobacterales bacterium]MBV9367690.1 hypothetical protein [Solirubrobacterales bacterium]MBV9809699.1 hypothetical protein [Solirubrobacterales bacterium]
MTGFDTTGRCREFTERLIGRPNPAATGARGRIKKGTNPMICRIWRGWTTPQNAAAYEEIVRGEVIPEIEARHIPGFRAIELMRRSLEDVVEFATIMWFVDIDAVKTFVGEDYETAHVPQRARNVLARFDERSAHYEILDRRDQFPTRA